LSASSPHSGLRGAKVSPESWDDLKCCVQRSSTRQRAIEGLTVKGLVKFDTTQDQFEGLDRFRSTSKSVTVDG
jgi:hypothetical protein